MTAAPETIIAEIKRIIVRLEKYIKNINSLKLTEL